MIQVEKPPFPRNDRRSCSPRMPSVASGGDHLLDHLFFGLRKMVPSCSIGLGRSNCSTDCNPPHRGVMGNDHVRFPHVRPFLYQGIKHRHIQFFRRLPVHSVNHEQDHPFSSFADKVDIFTDKRYSRNNTKPTCILFISLFILQFNENIPFIHIIADAPRP